MHRSALHWTALRCVAQEYFAVYTSHHITSHHITPHHIISHHIRSHQITSDHIRSQYHTVFHRIFPFDTSRNHRTQCRHVANRFRITLLQVIPTMANHDEDHRQTALAFYMTYILAYFLAYILAFYLTYTLTYVLPFCQTSYLSNILASYFAVEFQRRSLRSDTGG